MNEKQANDLESMNPMKVRYLLSETRWGAMMSERHLSILSEYLFSVDFPEDDIVFESGEYDRFMCFLIWGEVEVYRASPKSLNERLGGVPGGRAFGHVSFFTGKMRSSTAVGKKGACLLILRYQSFCVLKNTHPDVAMNLMDIVIQDMAQYVGTELSILLDYVDGD